MTYTSTHISTKPVTASTSTSGAGTASAAGAGEARAKVARMEAAMMLVNCILNDGVDSCERIYKAVGMIVEKEVAKKLWMVMREY